MQRAAADDAAPNPFPGPDLPKGQTPGGYLPTGMTGRFHGKMIMFNTLLDVMAPTGGAVLYDAMVREAAGDRPDDTYRLWWVDNSCHTGLPFGPSGGRDPRTYAVMYGGIMQEAVRNLIEWIEEGTEPASFDALPIRARPDRAPGDRRRARRRATGGHRNRERWSSAPMSKSGRP